MDDLHHSMKKAHAPRVLFLPSCPCQLTYVATNKQNRTTKVNKEGGHLPYA
jgi:hypothetical protein